ncbi:phosphonate metabolism transcriptional regulator PhnF [Chelativorans intermedius]|uniref:Phosphonate metabolism transcriptional regulator PhnF n=1 Tax=Chelativorans intermedius TaxID=515947 RepID=A0ABV6D5K4_9HYPH|nr:phosphonate metabolism transcriptional regulator PhnF [Chelativorans intermedius]MCT8998835.1 phosphonate metabolism transcriptional regulator PhnF [Chelativorans intermedius]
MTARPEGSPLWRFIADSVGREIAQRVYAPGDRLPTETELAQRFGVNRHTVRRAVASLQDQGLVRIEQGRGTFVQEDVVDYPLSRRTRFSEIVQRQAKSPSGHCLRIATVPADAQMAEALSLAPGAPVALIETVGMVDDHPVSLAAHHFPLERFPHLFEAYEAERKITPMFRRLGVEDYLRRSTKITARMPDAYEVRHLRLARTAPVLCLEAVNVDGKGMPIEYGLTRFAASRVQVLVDTLPA